MGITVADILNSEGNELCFMRPLNSCDMKISVVSQCRILVFCCFLADSTCTCQTDATPPLLTDDWDRHRLTE